MMPTFVINMRQISRLSVFFILALLLVTAANQILPAIAVMDDKEVIAGVPANFPPQYQVDAETGEPYGFAIDVMDEVAQQSGIKVKYVVYHNVSEVTVALRNGQIDIVPNLGITDERKNYTDFTAPVETFQIKIFMRSTTDDIKKPDDLTGRKVAVVTENQGYVIMKERGGAELLVYNSMEEALMSLISGNADAMVFPYAPLIHIARQSGIEDQIKTTGESLAEIRRAIGVRKGQPELYNKLDETVKTFVLTPEYQKLYQKWYGKPEPFWNTERVLIAVGIAIALIAVLSFIIHYFSVLRLNKKLEDSLKQLGKSGESLRLSEERYRTLAEAAHDTIFIIDGDDHVQYVNNFAAKLFGRKPEEIIGKSRKDIFPSPGAEHQKQNLQNVFETGESIYAESKALFPAGEIWLGTRLVPLRNEKGKIVAVMGISRDITKHKLADEALRQSEELFRALSSNTPDHIIMQDSQLRYLFVVNPHLGLTEQDMIGKTDYDFLSKNEADKLTRVKKHVMETGKPLNFETSLISKDGKPEFFDGTYVPRYDAQGKIEGIIGYFRKVTERKKAEEALLEKEHLLSESQQIAHIGSWHYDMAGKILWSDEMYRIYGVSPDTFTLNAESFINLIHPDDRPSMQAWIDACLAGEKPGELEFRIILPDGSVRFINGRGELQYDAGNRPSYMAGTAQDITERKRAEEELQKNQEVLKLLIEHTPAAIAMFDSEMKYIAASKRFLEDYELGDQHIIGKSHYEVFPEIPDRWKEIHRRCLAGATERCEEDPFTRTDGRLDWIRWEICPWYELPDIIGGIILFSEVITKRKLAEEELDKHRNHLEEMVAERTGELAQSQKALMNMVDELNKTMEELRNANLRLTELDRMKSMFIATTSHELRTPLNSIIGFSSVLLEGWSGKLTGEQKEQLQLIHDSGQQLLALINDVIDISKIEAGKLEAYHTEFRLKEVVDEAVATLRRSIDEKGLALSVDVPDITMRTDRRRLLQCIINYLSNAVKFTEKGSIKLTAKSINDRIDISITDTGVGMKEEDISKLFTPFVRLESPISAQAGGTGLGLYLTKKLAEEALGGTVAVKSTYGKGSTFSLRIPVEMETKS